MVSFNSCAGVCTGAFLVIYCSLAIPGLPAAKFVSRNLRHKHIHVGYGNTVSYSHVVGSCRTCPAAAGWLSVVSGGRWVVVGGVWQSLGCCRTCPAAAGWLLEVSGSRWVV